MTRWGKRHGEKNPRPLWERGFPFDGKLHYRLPRLDALSGLSFAFAEEIAAEMWDARLQFPFFHLMEGSGHAVQYQAVEASKARLQPLHCSTISWQIPPL